jgi:hypothetical protein
MCPVVFTYNAASLRLFWPRYDGRRRVNCCTRRIRNGRQQQNVGANHGLVDLAVQVKGIDAPRLSQSLLHRERALTSERAVRVNPRSSYGSDHRTMARSHYLTTGDRRVEAAPAALCFCSGMAAITTLCLSLLKSEDHVIISEVVYGGANRSRSSTPPLKT